MKGLKGLPVIGVGKILIGVVLVALLLVWLASYLIEGPLRQRMESGMNASLKGYSVELRAVDFHPIGFSVTLRDLVIRQDAHPEKPVANFPYLHAHVHWKAVLRGRLVAEFNLKEPQVNINLTQLRSEVKSEVPVEERGWQEAALSIYPLKINLLTIDNGDFVYIDEDPKRPLHLSEINFAAENIRNVYSPEGSYPSPFSLQARIFETGQAWAKGSANFLAEPFPGIETELAVDKVALDYLRPVLSRYNLKMGKGVFSGAGRVEYAPDVKILHLKNLTAYDLHLDYVHAAETAPREERRVEKTKEVAREVSNQPDILVRVDDLHLTGRLGIENKATNPPYRLFVDQLDFRLINLSNQFSHGDAKARLTGVFMGSGRTLATATFRPEDKGPDFDLNVKIEGTRLAAMNDLLRVYGNFDVTGGLFSLYSEIRVKNDQIDGYLKPLFKDLNVYDRRQDKEKGLFRKMYEGLVGGLLDLLKNQPRDQVATRADLSGQVENPRASTWQIIVRLVQNAFLKAILPGFEREVSPDRKEAAKEK